MSELLINAHALDGLRALRDESFDVCVTSPPYFGMRNNRVRPVEWPGARLGACLLEAHAWVRDEQPRTKNARQGSTEVVKNPRLTVVPPPNPGEVCAHCGAWRGELGQEPRVSLYASHLVRVFDGVRRALKPSGSLWLVLGDSYAGSGGSGGDYWPGGSREGQARVGRREPSGALKAKDLCGVPWAVALALRDAGWFLRSAIVWNKPGACLNWGPDRPTSGYEFVFYFSKTAHPFYRDVRTVGDGTCRMRDVWTIPTEPYKGAHYSTFPRALVRRILSLALPVGGNALDPFVGTGTTLLVARELAPQGAHVGIELNADYVKQAQERPLLPPLGVLFEYP
mgnify:CR=1 FL=1